MSSPQFDYEPIFIAKQPVFNRNLKIWGYELLFRRGTENSATIVDENEATAKVIVDGYTLARSSVAQGSQLLINFPGNLILSGAAKALPKEHCIVEILEHVQPTPDVLNALSALKKEGFKLALDDFFGEEATTPFLDLADIIKIDILGKSPQDIRTLANKLQKVGRLLLAEKVETAEEYKLTHELGFHFFQGYFFSKPEIIPGRKISAGNIGKLRLLGKLAHEDVEIDDLVRIVSEDISLSYRLLQYINSASFSKGAKVSSIKQAVIQLGLEPLREWLMLVAMSDMAQSPRTRELATISATRGKFFELLGKAYTLPFRPDSLFLLGLLSKLDALLGMTKEETIKDMPLSNEIHDALIGKDNKARHLLDMVEGLERARFDEANITMQSFSILPDVAARYHIEAQHWAHSLVSISQDMGTKSN